MRVQVGPLGSSGVLAWVAYARTVVDEATSGRHPELTLEPEVAAAFRGFLDEWQAAAEAGGEFLWATEVDPEQVEFLAHAFHHVAVALANAAERRGFPLAPSEGDEFYLALVTAFLDALGREGGARSEFAEELASTWPGLDLDDG